MQNSALDIWISGAIAVVTVDFLVYPFDTLKTRIQSPAYSTVYKDASTNTIKKNILFRGLYQGVFSVVLSTIPSCTHPPPPKYPVLVPKVRTGIKARPSRCLAGAFFTTYETVKSTLNTSSSPILQATPAPLINGLSSSAGEMVSCLLLTPAEVIKQNAQVINRGRNGPRPKPTKNVTLQVLARFKRHPWKLWSGYSALVGRNLPTTGVNFPIFEAVKGCLVERRRQRRRLGSGADSGPGRSAAREIRGDAEPEPVYERAVLTGAAASISGSIASVVTTPIDVVKTRMMLAASDSASGSTSRREGKSVWVVGRRIFRDEGVRGLFRGGAIRVVWTALSLSIYLGMTMDG
ncbi:mitochondrial carrier domain-containing protein [Aspergillus aurantiobrunneus]